MRSRRGFILLVVVGVAIGCRGDSTKSVVVELPETYYGPHPSTWLPQSMHCENLVPLDIRSRFFPGAQMIERPEMPSHVMCRFTRSPLQKQVAFICRDEVMLPDSMKNAKDLYKGVARGREIPGIGRLALAWGTDEVKFWDDDTNCEVDILWLGAGDQIVDMARALALHLSPRTVSK